MADRFEPKELRSDDVAGNHNPISPRVMTERAVHECETFVWIRAIPRDEEFHAIGVADDRARRQSDLTHAVDVILRDQVLETVDRPQRQHQGEHHAEAGEDRPGDEIRRENRRMPTGQQRNGEVEGDDGVNGKNQRGRNAGQHEVSHFVVAPVAVRTAPAHRKKSVDKRAGPLTGRLEAITQNCEVRQQADIPKEHRNRSVGRDGEYVPLERRTEILPDRIRVRDRKEIKCVPHATDVKNREDTGAHDSENCHGLGRTIDRRAPFLPQQAEDRGDQGAGVTNTNPEDEIDDVPRPVDRIGVAPNADARRDEV